MKHTIASVLVAVMVPWMVTNAQEPRPAGKQRPGSAPGGPLRPLEARKLEQLKVERAVERTAVPGEPEGKMTVTELLLKRNELKGKVIELTFDKVVSLKQAGKEGYMALITYESLRAGEGVMVAVPAEGLEFFEELNRPEVRRRVSVYVQILSPDLVRAVGTRYRKSEPEGERYRW